MISVLRPIEPDRWTVVFHVKRASWWVELLAFGRFKHVSAFAYVPLMRAWLVYDVQQAGTSLTVIPDCDSAITLLDKLYGDCVMLSVRRQEPCGNAFRLGFWCVPAIKHLLGVRCGALRPDALYRHLRRNGAELIDNGDAGPAAERHRSGTRVAAPAG